MTKFNLKEHIAKNKATFFGSLTEGQFSWMTQDTGQQIGSQDENKISVYMFDDKGKYWFERDYDGYGVFGGKDYYELLDQMNGGSGDRSKGIDLAFDKSKEGETLFPALVVSPSNFNYKTHDFTKEAEHDPNQSWYDASYEDDDEDDDYYNDEDEDELDEGKVEEAYNTYTFKVAKNFAKYMSKKEGRDFEVTMNSVDEYSFDLDLDGEPYAGGSYLIQNGNIHNVAIPGNPIYATTDDMEDYIGEGYMGQFYAPEYIEKKYGKEMAKQIEDEIYDMDENSWDRFTGMESAEEVDEYIADIVSMLKEGYDEFKRADKGSKNVTAKNKGEEEVYGAGVKKGEEIEKKKMKVSEFKSKIKEMILAEMNVDVTDETSGYDFLAELEGMLNEAEGLTPLQDYVYQYEIEISGEDEAQDFLDDIRKLNTPDDVYNYYAYDRDWSGSMDDDLENIYRQVKRKFKNLNEAEDDKHVVMKGNKFYTGTEFVDNMEDAMKYNLKSATEIAKEKKGMVYTPKAVKEAKKDEVEDEVDIDIESPEAMDAPMGGINVTQNADADLTGTEKEVQDNLEAAMEAAKKLGDEKLSSQIGNTLTFFTRQHVVKEELNEAVGFSEMENEFEGAMEAGDQTKEEYLRDIIDTPSSQIDLSGYYEVENAVEQGDYSRGQAIKRMKTWAQNKMNELGLDESKNINEVKFKIGDTLQTYGGGEEVKVLDIKPNLAAALADTKNPKTVKELEKDLRQDLIDREDRNKPFYLVTSESFPVNKYYVESELEGLINESMFPMLKKILK